MQPKHQLSAIILLVVLLNYWPALALNDGAGNEYFSSNVGIKVIPPTTALDVNGAIKFGTSDVCDPTREGSQRYNSTSKTMQFCNGTAWRDIGSTNGGAKVLLSAKTASNNGSIAFTGIDGTYAKYVVEIYNVKTTTAQVGLLMRVSEDTGPTYTYKIGGSDYTWAFNYIDSGAAPTLVSDVDDSEIELVYTNDGLRSMSDISIASLEGEIYLIAPFATGTHRRFRWSIGYGIEAFDPDARTALVSGSGTYRSTTNPITAIEFRLRTGTITTGTFKLYGLL